MARSPLITTELHGLAVDVHFVFLHLSKLIHTLPVFTLVLDNRQSTIAAIAAKLRGKGFFHSHHSHKMYFVDKLHVFVAYF